MSAPLENEFFDIGDKTALVCVDHLQYQKLVVPQIADLGYKIHLGLFEEDVLLKLATYNYNVVVVYENFKRASADENPILRELVKRPGALRRQHFVVLLSHRGVTNDPMLAFTRSVDLVVNIEDLPNLKPVLRRGVAHHAELYQPFRDVISATQAV
jgi:hypothetical protein